MGLGQGLASLIPKRNTDSAEDIIEQIDSMEVLEEEPEHVAALKGEPTEEATEEAVAEESEPEEEATQVAVTTDEEEEPAAQSDAVSVIEEFEELERVEPDVAPPSAPQVTPLEIDPATGEVQAEPVAEQPKPKKAPAKKKAPTKKEVAEVVEEPVRKVLTPDEFAIINDEKVLGNEVEYIAIGDIEVNPLQPRRTFDEEALVELKDSLEQHGMLQPIVLMRKEEGDGYYIIAGERRWRASKELKWTEVPAVIRDAVSGDRNKLELALTENVQRQNLNPIEEAMGYKQLMEDYGMSHEDLAKRVGKSRPAITNSLRMLQLPAEVQRGLIDEKITIGHAKAILMIPDPEKQQRFYQHVVDEGLTVRKAENRARNIQRAMKVDDPLRQRRKGRPQIAQENEPVLQSRFGYNTRIKFNIPKNRFEVIFYAYSEKEAKEVIGRLAGTEPLPEDEDADVLAD